jgi:hypothetical protein
MENEQNADRFSYTRRPSRFLQLSGDCLVFAGLLAAIPHFATPGAGGIAWNVSPLLIMLLIAAGVSLIFVRSKLHISPDGNELVESRTVLGMTLSEKRSKVEFNSVVVERDWDVDQPEFGVQYIVKLVGPRTIFYVDEITYFRRAEEVAEDLAKALNLSIVKEGCFPARFK